MVYNMFQMKFDKSRQGKRGHTWFEHEIVAARQSEFHLFEHQTARLARRAFDIGKRTSLCDDAAISALMKRGTARSKEIRGEVVVFSAPSGNQPNFLLCLYFFGQPH